MRPGDGAGALDEALALDDIDILERNRGGDRVPRIGKAMDEIAASFEHLDDMARNLGGGDRQIARRQPLRNRHKIGVEANRLARTSVVAGTSVSVRLILGVRSYINKKKTI